MGLGKKMFKRRKVIRIKQERSMGMTNKTPIGSMTLGTLTELIDSQISLMWLEAECRAKDSSEVDMLRAELETTKTKLSVAELALSESRETASKLARYLMMLTEQPRTAERADEISKLRQRLSGEPEYLWPMNSEGGVI